MSKYNGSNGKSMNFSCRLVKDTFSILEKEAESKNISLNSLINNVLGRYVALDRHAKDIELISLTKRAVRKIFSEMDDKTIKEIADEVGGVVHRELVFLKFDELTFDNLMQVLVINASRYGSVKYTNENQIHKICIHHGACIEFSKFIALIHEKMGNYLSVKTKVTNSDQNTLCMEITEPL
jgi:hypothetical protein